MKRHTLSLKQSIFLTIVIASAFLILAFTHLQLTREAYRTSEHQIRETQLSLLLAKEIMESKLKTAAEDPLDQLIPVLENLSTKMQILQDPLLLSSDGSVLYPKNELNPNAATDQKRIQEILLTYDLSGDWFRPLPTPDRSDALDIFTPLFSPGGVHYILKTTVTLDSLKNAFQRTYRFVILIFLMVFLFAIFLGIRVKKKILDPIQKLSKSTAEIADGNLDQEILIETGDEIEELATSFNQMTKQLAVMRNQAEDSNPLTHLPGNNVIAAEIDRRLRVGAKIAVVHADLDRFKIYNDSYGIQRGDEVIKMTAEVLKEAVLEKGAREDLVAHEGGDDFVVVTTPVRLEQIANEIITRFDARKGNHYREQDRTRGFILIPDRRAKDPAHAPKVEIPLMSISLAAVTNEAQSFATYNAIATALVAMKKQAKSIRGSSFVVSK